MKRTKAEHAAYMREYYWKNRDAWLRKAAAHREKQRDKINARNRARTTTEAYRATRRAKYAANPEPERKAALLRYSRRKDMVMAYIRHRFREDPIFKLVFIQRNRVRDAIKRLRNASKSSATMQLIGCSAKQLAAHLEAQFLLGMTWQNYGRGGWHVDHIRPCASFDLTDRQQQRACFNYRNLQPLWELDNLRKGAKWPCAA